MKEVWVVLISFNQFLLRLMHAAWLINWGGGGGGGGVATQKNRTLQQISDLGLVFSVFQVFFGFFSAFICFSILADFDWLGVLTQKQNKKPVATPKSVNWHWFFGFFKFPNWHWFFFWFFFWFFWHWFWPEFEIGNWFFLVSFGFFCFFWLFLVFFGIGLGQHSKLETGFLGSVGFFGFFFGFVFGFLGFFGFFFGI